MEHEAGEGHEVQAGQGLGQPLVVAGQAAEARHPGEAALHDPAPRQQHEAALGLRVLDHLQVDAVGRRRLGRVIPGVALVDVGQVDARP
jgi:glucokinase